MRQFGLEPTGTCLFLKFLACEPGLGDRRFKRFPCLVRSRPMHDDLARPGVRGRHLLTPLHRLPLGVVQLLPRLADPQAQSNLRTKLRRQSRFRPLGTISVRFPVGPALLPISVEVQQGLPMGDPFSCLAGSAARQSVADVSGSACPIRQSGRRDQPDRSAMVSRVRLTAGVTSFQHSTRRAPSSGCSPLRTRCELRSHRRAGVSSAGMVTSWC